MEVSERSPVERVVDWCVATARGVVIDGPSGLVNISSKGAMMSFASVSEALTWISLVSSIGTVGKR
jgi:hypothetical protein